MILELDISILNKIEDITLGQLVFLNLVVNEKQSNSQEVSQLLSLVSEAEIQDLIERELLSVHITNGTTIYNKTDKLDGFLKEEKSWFDEFYDLFPAIVHRPDGLKGFLRTNVNKCRKLYGQIVGKSKAKHQHIINCLRTEISQRTMTGKLGYMKTMWRWLTNSEWEAIEEQMKDEASIVQPMEDAYGTTII